MATKGAVDLALPWGFVFKITNYNQQISNKFQIAINNDQNLQGGVLFGYWDFDFWILFDICDLMIVISML